MPTISDLEYGYDASGVDKYLEEIKAIALTEAKDAVENVDDIVKCCEDNWEGQARENFVNNLRKDAKHVGEQFVSLYNVLQGEINSVHAAMANKDEELIKFEN
ncbi:MAG: hypothetical protein IKH54_00745 [Bacilli bacterium]|nr:hypothetical protein [Bacilli bacterium]